MIVHDDDDDLQFNNLRLHQSFYSQYHINEDEEDNRIRFTEISIVSDTENNTELESEHHMEEQNQEDQEDILLRLKEVSVESDPQLDDLPQGLDNARRRVAEQEIHGGFKHKFEKDQNQVHFFQDPAYVQYDMKEEEDILRQLESESEFKTQQNDNKEDEEDFLRHLKEEEDILRQLKEEEDILRQLESESTGSKRKQYYHDEEDDEILRQLNESARSARSYQFKKIQNDLYICSNCHQKQLPDKERMDEEKLHEEASSQPPDNDPLTMVMESVLASVNAGENRDSKCHRTVADSGCKHKIEDKKQKYLDRGALYSPCGNEREHRAVHFLVSLLEAVKAREEEQKGVQKMRTEKIDPFDLRPLQDLEEIVLKFYQFIDQIIPMLKDTEKVRFELQDKLKFLQKVNDLLLTSSRTINKLIKELERMKNDGKTQKIPEILVQLMKFNAHLVEQSFHHGIGFLFNNKCTKNEMSDCVKGLNQSRENLGTVLTRIREMINTKRFGLNASPKLPDGYER